MEYSEADHTQRWEVFGQGPDEWVADCGIGGNSEQCARLIAAAPELLQALESALEWLYNFVPESQSAPIVEKCEAAIAKATGGAK